jgi:molecular chaperone DnaK
MDERQDDLTGKLIIGIDLGTTKSGVAAWSPVAGKVIMLADADGYDLTPSVAAWDRHQRDWRVGRAAKDLALESPGDAIYSIKRYIGRWFNDRAVLYGRPDLTYDLVSGGGADPLRDVVADLGIDLELRYSSLPVPTPLTQ